MFAVIRWFGQKTNFLNYLFCTLRSGGLDIVRQWNSDVAKGNPNVGSVVPLLALTSGWHSLQSFEKRMSIKGLARFGWPVGMLLWEGPDLCGWDFSRGLYEEVQPEPVIKPAINVRSSRVSVSSFLNNELWAGCVR